MGLEAGQFISDLVISWPLPTDRRREGDDHLRLLKTTIKNTFPNINAAVTATPKQLNSLPTASTTEHIKELIKHIVPMGTIVMWSGTDATVPVGWAICNGQVSGNFGTTPDLRSRFIIGAGPSNLVKTTGGDALVSTSAAGAHEHVVDPVALTVSTLPSHSHRVYACTGTGGSSEVVAFGATGDVAFIGDQNNIPKGYTNTNGSARTIVEPAGSGSTHVHGMQPVAAHAHTVKRRPGLLCSDVYHQGYGLRPANIEQNQDRQSWCGGACQGHAPRGPAARGLYRRKEHPVYHAGAGAFLGHKAIFEATDFPLMWLKPFPPLTAPLWVYGGMKEIGVWDGAHTDITRISGPYTGTEDNRWQGEVFNGVGIFNNGIDLPQYWASFSVLQKLVDLPNWPTNIRAGFLRPFKNFLIAGNITEGQSQRRYRVRWSHPAAPGTIPTSWALDDPTKSVWRAGPGDDA